MRNSLQSLTPLTSLTPPNGRCDVRGVRDNRDASLKSEI